MSAAVLLAAAGPAAAADLQITVRSAGGAPVPNAVVSVYPAGGDHAPRPTAEPLVLGQKDILFSPYVLVAPVGSTVSFPNRDTVRHHVYSFSAPHRFNMKLYGRQERPAERFDKPGVVALGCNIHDAMQAYVFVADTRYAAKTDADGQVRLKDLPPGKAVVKVWAANAKTPGGMLSREVIVAPANARLELAIETRAAAPGKQDH